MNSSIAAINLEIQQPSVPVTVPAKQGDSGRLVRITLSDGGFPYTIAPDCYAVLTALKPDGNILYNHCSIEANTILYEITPQTTAAAGRMTAEIKLYGADDALLTSAAFRFIIDGTVYDDGRVESADEVSALTHLVSEAAGIIKDGNQMIGSGEQTLRDTEDAARKAEAASQQAEKAAQAANSAAQNAAAAAQTASQAASSVDAAVRSANEASKNADAAASRASEAAHRITAAREEAEAAAQAGSDAVRDAQAAVKAANIAVSEANTAANRANAAAILAENASDAAWEANQKADILADTVSRLHSQEAVIVETASGRVLSVQEAACRELKGLKLYGKTIQNGTPSPDAPILPESAGEGGSITVTVAGKNLFQDKRSSKADVTSNGVTFTTNPDGTFTANGTNETTTRSSMTITAGSNWLYLPAGTYTVSSGVPNNEDAYLQVSLNDEKVSDGSTASYIYNTPKTIVLDKPQWAWLSLNVKSARTVENLVFKPQIEVGTAATEYAPYPDYQTAAVATLNGLRGIPAAAGGNFTDETGQHWWCDTLDLETGTLERRTIMAVLDGTHSVAAFAASGTTHHRIWFDIGEFTRTTGIGNGYFCSHLPYKSTAGETGWFITTKTDTEPSYIALTLPDALAGSTQTAVLAWLAANPITVVAGRADVLYENLTEETLAQYAALRTHKPDTTIYNNAGAYMDTAFVADPKLYIDRKFSELSAALLQT